MSTKVLKVQKSTFLKCLNALKGHYEEVQHVTVSDGTVTAYADSVAKARSMYHTYVFALPVQDLKSKGYMK